MTDTEHHYDGGKVEKEQVEPLLPPVPVENEDDATLVAYRVQKYGDLEFDDALKLIGFGPHQIRQYLLLAFTGFLGIFHMFSAAFLCASPDHRCLIPEIDKNTTCRDIRHSDTLFIGNHLPFNSEKREFSLCERYDGDIVSNISTHLNTSRGLVGCSEYIYDCTTYEETIVTEWDLVCDKAYLKALSESLFMAGVLVGAVVFGMLSDRHGRKPILLISLLLQFVFGCLSAVMPEIITFCISRFIEGCAISGVFLTAFVMGNELIPSHLRTFLSVLFHLPGTAGGILLGLAAYYIRDWRYLEVVITLPGLLVLPYSWLVDESVRWLLANGKHTEAEKIFKKAADSNNVSLASEFSLKKHSDLTSESSVLDLLRTSNLRKNTLIIFYSWFVCSLIFYAIQLNIEGLPGDDYTDYWISMAVEVPVIPICLYSMHRLGRRPTLFFAMLTGGFSVTLVGFVPKAYTGTTISMAMIGKTCLSISFTVVYQLAVEVFPTVTRNVGIGSSSMCARVGGILAPFVILLEKHYRWLPYIILGSSALLCASLTYLLPETNRKQLPETLEEGEQFGRKAVKSVMYKKNMNHMSSSKKSVVEKMDTHHLVDSDEEATVYIRK